MLCLSGFELYSRWVPLYNVYNYHTYAYIYRNSLNTKIHSTMLCLSGLNYILVGCPRTMSTIITQL